MKLASSSHATGSPETDFAFEQAKVVIGLHCDPESGARYWIETALELGLDIERDINGWDDLGLFGWMDEDAMRARPIDAFVSAASRLEKGAFHLAETSGFTGPAKTAVFSREEFLKAFVIPFEVAAGAVCFPARGRWLWIGPSGPHPIGQAARIIARRSGPNDPFTVDFDPRWFNKLAPDSFARKRYLDHLVEQSLRILERERIEVLFTTPSVLEELTPHLTPAMRARVRGIHYGGQPLGVQRMLRFEQEVFPSAVHLSGYGNSMFGVSMELGRVSGRPPRYFPHEGRVRIDLVDPNATADVQAATCRRVAVGERGRVVMHRFDKSMMILNMLERDVATRIESTEVERRLGFVGDGVEAPELARELRAGRTEGIY